VIAEKTAKNFRGLLYFAAPCTRMTDAATGEYQHDLWTRFTATAILSHSRHGPSWRPIEDSKIKEHI